MQAASTCPGGMAGDARKVASKRSQPLPIEAERSNRRETGMDYVNLGTTGLKVSRICLGMMSFGEPSDANSWMLGADEARPFLKKAADAGINFFDTADAYSAGASEHVLGDAMRDLGLARDSVVLATKVYFPTGTQPNQRGLSRKHIRHAIDGSLKRMKVDYVDLYQIHRFDVATPMEETLEALDDVVRAGKALHVGASSMYAWQFMNALALQKANGWARFVSMQNYWNLAYREEEREMVPLCRDQGVGVIPWSPLARGFLAHGARSDTRRSQTEQLRAQPLPEDVAVFDALKKVADARGLPTAQVALAWLLHKPGLTAPIIGATKLKHLEDAIAATEVTLSPDELLALEAPYKPHAVTGHGYGDAIEALARMRAQR